MADDKQIIFSLVGVGRVHPPKRHVLKDIYLSFFYGAKIGVLGLNGSGKSTLLRIIAGVDKDYIGEVSFSKGSSSLLISTTRVANWLTNQRSCETKRIVPSKALNPVTSASIDSRSR